MSISKNFYPDEYLDSAYHIDFEKLAAEGYRGVLFDIDNTLVPHGAPADARACAFFERLHRLGFCTCLISNNKKSRVEPFAKRVGSAYIENAHKPSKKNYLEGCRLMGTGAGNTLFVGDQLFTDIWGAKKAGIRTILVKPIHPKEEIQIVLKRYLERVVLHFYRKEEKK